MRKAYPVILTPQKKGIGAFVHDFDIDTQGDNIAHAMTTARDAITKTCIAMQERKETLPEPTDVKMISTTKETDVITLIDITIPDEDEDPPLENFLTYCKNFAIAELNDFIGFAENIEVGDVVDKITGTMIANESATMSTYKAKKYIKKWWNEAGCIYEQLKDEYNEVVTNPFDEPEKFHLLMITDGVEKILSACPTTNNLEYNEKLNDELIRNLIKEIKNVDSVTLYDYVTSEND